MGLLTRLRSHDRSKSQDLPDLSQSQHSASSSGGSEFSVMTTSSQSSVEKSRMADPVTNQVHRLRPQGHRRASPHNRHSLPAVPSSPLHQTYPYEAHGQNQEKYSSGSTGQDKKNKGFQNPDLSQNGYHAGEQIKPHHAHNFSVPPNSRHPAYGQTPLNRMLSQRVASGVSTSSFEVSSADISGVSGSSGDSSDEGSETLQDSHPYYRQWKEYYETLAKQKLDPKAVIAQQMPNASAQSAQPEMNISSEFLNQAKTKDRDNLVLNSRKSTIKSNRSASVPSFGHALAAPRSRAVSVNTSSTATPSNMVHDTMVSGPESNGNHETVPNNIIKEEVPPQTASPSKQSSQSPVSDGSRPAKSPEVIHSSQNEQTSPSNDRNMSPRRDVSQISDYAAYIFYDDDEEENTKNESTSPNANEVSRQSSTASASSYNSLQSEKKFSVGRHPSRIATPSQQPKPVRRNSTFNPPMSGPPPPIYPNMQRNPQKTTIPEYRHSMVDPSINNVYMQQMQQQIMQLQQMQQMQQINGGHFQPQYTNTPKSAISSDSRINARIQDFFALRQAIASGNKTIEFRLEWLKMLVCAINYKLFSYINIRGEPIYSEQISANKQFFINSAQTHLQKLLRDFNGGVSKGKEKIYAEVCYIQGCLSSQSYLERFYQDFGYERDDEEAEHYFNLAIEYDPLCFKAYYELGELYESQDLEDKFDLALENYKESAKLGYNRAIYKVALIYLVVPKVRSKKFFRYFKNLADIDMESQEIQLSGIDLEELEQVVGLAQFQLGKIYEGIYPGDLTIEDQFVVDSLEVAPVNYAKSLSYYNRAAKLSCVQAQVKLGHVYEQGELNRPFNAVKSIQWYIKAATSPLKFKRHPEAMLGVSRWFMRGTDAESKHIPFKDEQMAVQWCERACKEFGSAEALYQMGVYAEDGYASGDPNLYFQEAAELGHQAAQERLGYDH